MPTGVTPRPQPGAFFFAISHSALSNRIGNVASVNVPCRIVNVTVAITMRRCAFTPDHATAAFPGFATSAVMSFSLTTAHRCSRIFPSVAVGIAAMSAAVNSTTNTR